MASTERSLGWATSGTGDGPAGGYDSTRWRANAQKSDGNGVMLYGSYMAMSGATTSTLTIADGAALISGYTYETNGSVTISTSGLTGTYSVVIIANNSAGALTVSANGAGTTTVAVSTIRVALVTAAQLTTIQGAVGAALTVTIGTVVTAAGVISTITPAYPYASTVQIPAVIYGILEGPVSSSTIANATPVALTGYNSGTTSGEGIITADTASGYFTVALTGMYHVSGVVTWDTNTTGQRFVGLGGSGFVNSIDLEGWTTLATNFYSSYAMHISKVIYLNAGAIVNLKVLQNSGTSRTLGNMNFRLVRL